MVRITSRGPPPGTHTPSTGSILGKAADRGHRVLGPPPLAPFVDAGDLPRRRVAAYGFDGLLGLADRLVTFGREQPMAVSAVLLGVALPTVVAPVYGASPVDRRVTDDLARAVLFGVDHADPILQDTLHEPEWQAAFRALDPEVRARAAQLIARHAAETLARSTLGQLSIQPGFARLPKAEALGLLDLLGGTNPQLSAPARTSTRLLVLSDAFRALDPDAQAAKLSELRTTAGPETVSSPTEASPRAAFTLSTPTSLPGHEFRSGKVDAHRYTLTIDGQTITIIARQTPDPTKGHHHTVDEIAKGLAGLPPVMRARVSTVTLEPGPSPEDAFWRTTFNDPDHRAYMSAAGKEVHVYPSASEQGQAAVDGTLIHETAHLLTQHLWGYDNKAAAWAPWRDAAAKDGLTASRYARKSPGEDFSETLQLYFQVRGTPHEAEVRALLPARFAFIDGVLASPPPVNP